MSVAGVAGGADSSGFAGNVTTAALIVVGVLAVLITCTAAGILLIVTMTLRNAWQREASLRRAGVNAQPPRGQEQHGKRVARLALLRGPDHGSTAPVPPPPVSEEHPEGDDDVASAYSSRNVISTSCYNMQLETEDIYVHEIRLREARMPPIVTDHSLLDRSRQCDGHRNAGRLPPTLHGSESHGNGPSLEAVLERGALRRSMHGLTPSETAVRLQSVQNEINYILRMRRARGLQEHCSPVSVPEHSSLPAPPAAATRSHEEEVDEWLAAPSASDVLGWCLSGATQQHDHGNGQRHGSLSPRALEANGPIGGGRERVLDEAAGQLSPGHIRVNERQPAYPRLPDPQLPVAQPCATTRGPNQLQHGAQHMPETAMTVLVPVSEQASVEADARSQIQIRAVDPNRAPLPPARLGAVQYDLRVNHTHEVSRDLSPINAYRL